MHAESASAQSLLQKLRALGTAVECKCLTARTYLNLPNFAWVRLKVSSAKKASFIFSLCVWVCTKGAKDKDIEILRTGKIDFCLYGSNRPLNLKLYFVP